MDYANAARVLRDKAARTDFPEERKALLAKAEELEKKHGKKVTSDMPPSARPYKVNVNDIDDFIRSFFADRPPTASDYEDYLFHQYRPPSSGKTHYNMQYGKGDTTEYDETADQWDKDADDWKSGAELCPY